MALFYGINEIKPNSKNLKKVIIVCEKSIQIQFNQEHSVRMLKCLYVRFHNAISFHNLFSNLRGRISRNEKYSLQFFLLKIKRNVVNKVQDFTAASCIDISQPVHEAPPLHPNHST